MSARVAAVAPYASHQHITLTAGFQRHRKMISCHVIDDPYALGGAQLFACCLGRYLSLELDVQCNRVRTQHRHTDASDADAQLRRTHDLAQLAADLGLLLVRTGDGIDRRVVAEQIEGIRMLQHTRLKTLASETG